MNGLSELQARLTTLLQRRHAIASDAEAEGVANAALTGNDELTPAEQLEIYREQFWLRHTSSLLEDYPGLSGILGQGAWERLVEGYLGSYPPRSYTLRDLGAQLPDYVATCEWLEHPVLCQDMARLEWAYVEAFDAPDAPALDAAKLAEIPAEKWPTARLVLDPAVRLLKVTYPVATLRRQLKSAGEAPVEVPEPEPQPLVVYRHDGGLFHSQITWLGFELLTEFRLGRSLGEALQAVMQRVDDADAVTSNLQLWFRDWAAAGWFTRVETDPG